MSIDAMRWAKPIKTGRSSSKAVLTWLADMCGADLCAYPSIAALADATELDVKTVQSSLKRLVELGLIEDTGERRGATRQVIVYRLVGVSESYEDSKHTQKRESLKAPKNGTVKKTKTPKNGNVTENGCVQDGKEPENGSVSEGKTPNFGGKDPQKRDPESIRNLKDKGSTPLAPKGEGMAEQVSILIDHLNQNIATLADKLGKPKPLGFRKGTSAAKQVAARLREGFTVEDCLLVMDYLSEMWGADPEMREYLCPTTIFRASKFDERVVKATNW
ncbi:conserved phage C-terminal domain-containing protein, partial [Edwardsiella piscicida]|nr:conserved phage C-terminal domain-containing protein [Edwardsiella piscicida]ELV7536387.1 conserved phage C-terminal domain-containing protein [Edwardsiella piscicida]